MSFDTAERVDPFSVFEYISQEILFFIVYEKPFLLVNCFFSIQLFKCPQCYSNGIIVYAIFLIIRSSFLFRDSQIKQVQQFFLIFNMPYFFFPQKLGISKENQKVVNFSWNHITRNVPQKIKATELLKRVPCTFQVLQMFGGKQGSKDKLT